MTDAGVSTGTSAGATEGFSSDTSADASAGVPFEFFATCAAGFEQLLAREIFSFNIHSVRALHGQVAFSGTLEDAYRVCLWSRIASRVVLVIAHVDAGTSDELYDSLSAISWEEQLSLTTTFAVDAHGTNQNLKNTQFVALRAKDAICDRMQAKLGGRPNIDAKNPQVRVIVRLRARRATCGIDLAGQPLFKRGQSAAAFGNNLGMMRADFAAALLAAGGWHRICAQDKPCLVTMFSGQGTLAVEAMSAALDMAPGLYRFHWGFEHWLGHDKDAWDALIADAKKRAEDGKARASNLRLIALDSRAGAASVLHRALQSAGLPVEPRFISDFSSKEAARTLATVDAENALVITDCSWLSVGSPALEISASSQVRDALSHLNSGTTFALMSAAGTVGDYLRIEPRESYDIRLGRDEASISLYNTEDFDSAAMQEVVLKDGTLVPVLVAASDQLAARLSKVAKQRAKWARREDVSCYRVYDADLPDYAVAIDLYQASIESRPSEQGAAWLVIQEYAAPKTVDAALAHKRLLDVLAIAPAVLNVAPENVYVRVRQKAKGGSQYAQAGSDQQKGKQRARTHLIDEGGLAFEVDFESYLDTGIFLDHRDVRARIREMAKQTLGSKRFLNLFAYTGTATCYAADGGAKHTTTVDLSATYLEWAKRNMARNGFEGEAHEYVQADVVRWISEQRRTPNRWDLIFCDPPTFSNSKRMGRNSFDVQVDHAELLIGISRLLTRNGVCVFSCNLRGFKPDVEKLKRAGVEIEDITPETIPEDFERNAKIHHCYIVKRQPRPLTGETQ